MEHHIVVHTPTLELYKKVVQKALDNGYKWCSDGSIYIHEEHWQEYKKNTCIGVGVDARSEETIGYGEKQYYEYCNGYDIISAEEFLEDRTNKDYISSGDTISFEWNINKPGMWDYPISETTTSFEPEEMFGYTAIGKLNQSNNKFMGIIKNAFKSKEQKALDHFELGNGNGGLNNLGQQEFVDYLFETQKELRKGFIEQIVEEYNKLKK